MNFLENFYVLYFFFEIFIKEWNIANFKYVFLCNKIPFYTQALKFFLHDIFKNVRTFWKNSNVLYYSEKLTNSFNGENCPINN